MATERSYSVDKTVNIGESFTAVITTTGQAYTTTMGEHIYDSFNGSSYGVSYSMEKVDNSLVYGQMYKWNNRVTFSGTCDTSGTHTIKLQVHYEYNNATTYIDTYTLNLTVVASSVTVSFNSNGGSNNPPSQTVESGGVVILPSPGTKSGYSFTGWYEGSTLVGDEGDDYFPSSNITLTAGWFDNTYTYTLLFDTDGGTGGPSTQTVTTTATTYRMQIPYDVPTMSGYTFKGWILDEDPQSGILMDPGEYITFRADQLLTMHMLAKWEKKTYTYTLKYNMNGGTGSVPESNYAEGTETTYTFTITDEKPSRDKHEFLGWSKQSGATSPSYYSGGDITVNGDSTVTLYAVWQQTAWSHKLYYNANGGTDAPATQEYDSTMDTSYDFVISSEVPVYKGYKFLGWATNTSATEPAYKGGDTIEVPADSERTLYAVWKQIYIYTLKYDTNGGTGKPAEQSYESEENVDHVFTVSTTIPVRSDYIFLGWATDSSATKAEYQGGNEITVKANDTVTLYAVWKGEGPQGIRVNVKGTWYEGVGYVNVKGEWKLMDSMYLNVKGDWKEV